MFYIIVECNLVTNNWNNYPLDGDLSQEARRLVWSDGRRIGVPSAVKLFRVLGRNMDGLIKGNEYVTIAL